MIIFYKSIFKYDTIYSPHNLSKLRSLSKVKINDGDKKHRKIINTKILRLT